MTRKLVNDRVHLKYLLQVFFVIVLSFLFSDGLTQGFQVQNWQNDVIATDFPAFRMPFFTDGSKGLSVLPIEQGVFLNTNKAWGPNSGNIWQGKGITTSTSAGIRFKWRFFDAQIQPYFVQTSNRSFTLDNSVSDHVGYNLFQYYHLRINHRDRIGPSHFNRVFTGNSWARLVLGPISAGLSNENIQWGPGRRNPLLLNSNAPGFEHLSLHTNNPIDLYVAKFQTHIVVGRLNSSFNENSHLPPGRVHFSGINIAVSPWFSDNLHVGLIRTFTVNEGDLNGFYDYVPFFQSFLKFRFQNDSNIRGNDRHDQRASTYFNWYFPNSEFSIYAEFASDDHRADLRDLYLEPNHTRAYLLGFEKSFIGALSSRKWSLSSEIIHTEYTNTSHVRMAGLLSFYSHGTVRQGYTHYGQMLGASYGAGSNGMYVSAVNDTKWGYFGFLFERIAKNKDLYQRLSVVDSNSRPELELVFGIFGEYRLNLGGYGNMRLKSAFHAIQSKNRFYVPINFEESSNLKYYNPLNLNFQLILLFELP